MEEWMDRMFRDTWMPYYMERKALPKPGLGEEEEIALTVTPSVDIKEEEGKLIVAADIPGIDKDEVSINIRGDMLEISAEKKEEKEEKEEGYIKRERRYRKFYRSIPLPAEVDKENVEASLKDGVLRIALPKAAGEVVKKIEVK
jgi:HSP20 family protein